MSKETLSTSEKEVPKIKLGLQDKYEEEKKELPPETEALNPDNICLLYTSPSPRDRQKSRMPSSA